MPKARILVIEDNPDNYELVKFLLEQADYAVTGASDGLTGLKCCQDEHPDLVLLDMTIPEMDGWHLAFRLKADEATRDIVVVALTAHTLPGDRKKALDAGCDGYISKPLDVAHFNETIADYLARGTNR